LAQFGKLHQEVKKDDLTTIQGSIGVADSSFTSGSRENKYAIRTLAVNIFNQAGTGAKKKRKTTKFIKKKVAKEKSIHDSTFESTETALPLNL
jgi:hypothetical protein